MHLLAMLSICCSCCINVYGMSLLGAEVKLNSGDTDTQQNAVLGPLNNIVSRVNGSIVSTTDVMCPDGRWRIHRDWLCDGFPDCEGAWDENPAVCRSIPCPEEWVQCGDGIKCLRPWKACDGQDDCGDNSDEDPEFCENRSCYLDSHKCQDARQCVLLNFFCDGHIDCKDGSDEQQDVCTHVPCTSGLVRCPSGECIFHGWLCDGKHDCADGHDENNKICDYVDNLPVYRNRR